MKNDLIKPNVLIIEEDRNMEMILKAALLPEKFQLRFLTKETMGLLENDFVPQLIVFDHSSAILFARENFCEQIKEKFPDTPLMVLSAYPDSQLARYPKCMDFFIAKPFDLNYFLSGIEHCLLPVAPS